VVPSARLSGAYTNVTQLGTLTSLTVGAALAVTGASALAGGVTGRSGTRVPEIYVQATDPGAVGAGAIWIQT
jgi:hypothetical protein